jgi:hypothetical protein
MGRHLPFSYHNPLLYSARRKGQHTKKLKLSAASCGEPSIRNEDKPFRSLTPSPRQAAGNALAGGFRNYSGDAGYSIHRCRLQMG